MDIHFINLLKNKELIASQLPLEAKDIFYYYSQYFKLAGGITKDEEESFQVWVDHNMGASVYDKKSEEVLSHLSSYTQFLKINIFIKKIRDLLIKSKINNFIDFTEVKSSLIISVSPYLSEFSRYNIEQLYIMIEKILSDNKLVYNSYEFGVIWRFFISIIKDSISNSDMIADLHKNNRLTDIHFIVFMDYADLFRKDIVLSMLDIVNSNIKDFVLTPSIINFIIYNKDSVFKDISDKCNNILNNIITYKID